MSGPRVAVRCRDAAVRAALEASFRSRGAVVDGTDNHHDVAVYVDHDVHRVGNIVDLPADRWIAEVEECLLDAAAFFQRFLSSLRGSCGVAVAMTSSAGRIGFPSASVAAAVAGGLEGLVRSLMHEAPRLNGVLLIRGRPSVKSVGAGPDLPVGSDADVGTDASELANWASFAIVRIAADALTRDVGTLVEVSHQDIN